MPEHYEVTLEDAQYGGHLGFVPRYQVFRGFENSEEFAEYLQTLLTWEGRLHHKRTEEEMDQEVSELMEAMEKTIGIAKATKGMQQDFLASLMSLTNQYRLLQSAHDKH